MLGGLRSSVIDLSSLSVCPRYVVPPVANCSSGKPVNFTMPRSGKTPRDEVMKDCMRAALRLLADERICEGSAEIVRV